MRYIETEEIEMNEISSKSLDISISDPEGTYPRTVWELEIDPETDIWSDPWIPCQSLNVSLGEDGLKQWAYCW